MASGRRLLIALCLLNFDVINGVPAGPDPPNETAETWNMIAQAELKRATEYSPIKHRAKNVILFLGDGMGISTVTAGRILKGGEMSLLSFEKAPNVGLSKTYCYDRQVTDSAASSTAYQCGVKTGDGMLGVDPRVKRLDCLHSLQPDMQLTSILDWSMAEGKSVGIVTTTRVTHATPAGAYANVPDRDWEGDSMLTSDNATQCRDIARQFVEDYLDVQVMMGGGRQFFMPMNTTDPATNESFAKSGRRDFRDLTKDWLKGQKAKGRQAEYVWNSQQLRSLDLDKTDYLMGLFAPSHMAYEKQRNDTEQPSLKEMTEIAIKILRRNPKGFYLLVEGGRIDHSHHDNIAYHALWETVAFDNATEAAAALTSETETLTITTADHSHTMVVAGYQSRGHDILDTADAELDGDGRYFTTLLYGTGPGYRYNQTHRENTTSEEAQSPKYLQEAVVPMQWSSHGGEDVPIYARGPMGHLVHGVHEENYIAHLMAYASCVGDYKKRNDCPPLKEDTSGAATPARGPNVVVLLTVMLLSVLCIPR